MPAFSFSFSLAFAHALVAIAALWLALAIDRWLGEPTARLHPVVWMGQYLGWIGSRIAPQPHQVKRVDLPLFFIGALTWCIGGMAVWCAALLLQSLVTLHLPAWAAAVLLGLLLKPLFAWRMLRDEVLAVEAALAVSLDAGRAQLARLVSRDVSMLSEREVRESAIESLAENLNDSLVAPLFWFVLLGLPGAALYRFANTADAMWGYRDCATAATGPGSASGPRAPTMCSRGFPRASPCCCWQWRHGNGQEAWGARRAAHRRPTAAGRWPRWRCSSACGCQARGLHLERRGAQSRGGRHAPHRCAGRQGGAGVGDGRVGGDPFAMARWP
jgi:membrane protein required for beta-lactamase induction